MSKLSLFLVYRTDGCGYDEYDSFVVCSKSSVKAAEYIPSPSGDFACEKFKNGRVVRIDKDGKEEENNICVMCSRWTGEKSVKTQYLGIASDELKEGYIVCSSFNAG